MRLPGWLHRKADPFRVHAWSLDYNQQPLTVAECRARWPLVDHEFRQADERAAAARARAATPAAVPAGTRDVLPYIRRWFVTKCATISDAGRHDLLQQTARHLLDNRFPEPAALRALLELRDDLPPRTDGTMPPDHEVRDVVRWAYANLRPGNPWNIGQDRPTTPTPAPARSQRLTSGGGGRPIRTGTRS
jgi:hypothetical protein